MTEEEWNDICSKVTDRMLEHVRPFVCPLSHETKDKVRLIGTGTLIGVEGRPAIITCEHVAAEEPLNLRYSHSEDVFGYRGKWSKAKEPIDVAWTCDPIPSRPERSQIIASESISTSHVVSQDAELLFFYGFAGENSAFAFDQHMTNGTGYLTQQRREAVPDSAVIELLWPAEMPNWSKNTTTEARKNMRFSDPRGFSGALVWNTRFLETGGDLNTWSPNEARVTGILKRFDERPPALLATPIECVRKVMPII